MYLPYIQRLIEMFLMFHSTQIQIQAIPFTIMGNGPYMAARVVQLLFGQLLLHVINQERVAHQKPVLGFANPLLYAIGLGSSYTDQFSRYHIG